MRILILGAGSIGRRHTKNLLSLGVRDISAYDPNRSARRGISDEYGIPTHDDYGSAVAWEPEAAIICSPSHLHLSQARDLLNAGSHLFIEKPVAIVWEGVPELIQAADYRGKIVQVGFNLRFHPAVQLIGQLLREGRVGTPWVMRARFGHFLPQWRPDQDYRNSYSAHADQGGGVLMDSIHEIDYLLSWGGDVREVHSLITRTSDLEIDTEDYAAVLLRFASGAVGEARLDYLRYEKLREAEVIGSSGMVVWESRGKSPEHVLVRWLERGSKDYSTLYEDPEYDINESYVSEMRHFLKCVQGEESPLFTLEEAARSLSLVLSAKQDSGSGLMSSRSAGS